MHLKTLLLIATAVASVTAAPAPAPAVADDNACYYKRSISTWVKRSPNGAEIACGGGGVHIEEFEKRDPAMEGVLAAADGQCYYRRHKDGKTVGYKRGPDGQEFLCGGHGEEKRGEDLRADNACYYKRDESGAMVGYKRDPSGAVILCGAAE